MEIQNRDLWVQPYVAMFAVIAVGFIAVVVLSRAAKQSGIDAPLAKSPFTADIQAISGTPQTIDDVFNDPAVKAKLK